MIKKIFKQYKDENITLDKQEIMIEGQKYQITENYSVESAYSTTDTTNLGPYNGYSMRYVTVHDFAHKDLGNILEKGDIWGVIRKKTLDFVADLVPFQYGKICDIISFSIDAINESYSARADILNALISHNFEYQMYEIYDTDHIYYGDWYCLGYTMKDVVTGQLTLSADINNDHQLEYGQGYMTNTYYSPYYFLPRYVQGKIYDAYKGYGPEFSDRTPAYITIDVYD